ncbi:hypothetical protein L484_004841 [Morus notabilis]|uniref:Uncharacterized protein n=1 Tax=Morus notabilis TaxID=981085 RepID=W9RUG1_9ROSA|nr:hypothetical protein L484_004841 [Morus notabilis]
MSVWLEACNLHASEPLRLDLARLALAFSSQREAGVKSSRSRYSFPVAGKKTHNCKWKHIALTGYIVSPPCSSGEVTESA